MAIIKKRKEDYMFNIIKNMYKNYLLEKEIMYMYEGIVSDVASQHKEYDISKYKVRIWRNRDGVIISLYNKEEYLEKMQIQSLFSSSCSPSKTGYYIRGMFVDYETSRSRVRIMLDSHYNKLYQPIKEEVYCIVHQLYEIRKMEMEHKEKDDLINVYKFLNIPVKERVKNNDRREYDN